jgi:hypothetical protein
MFSVTVSFRNPAALIARGSTLRSRGNNRANNNANRWRARA